MSMINLSSREIAPVRDRQSYYPLAAYPRKPLRWRASSRWLLPYNSGMSKRSAGPPTNPRTDPTDPKWPKLLSLSAHEIRSPLSVVAGYVRMLLEERSGPLNDQQRQLLEKTQKSCGRLTEVLAQMSELSQLELGKVRFNRRTGQSARGSSRTPSRPCRPCPATRSRSRLTRRVPPSVDGDAVRLRSAFSSILHALRRELVTSDELVVRAEAREEDRRALGVHRDWRAPSDRATPPARAASPRHVRRMARRQWSRPAEGAPDHRGARRAGVERRRRR